ncbi:PIN domain-containing protein [Pseudomonas sp. R2.Fl]|nr:PIN domain-containing protein [Pseudomonas sp. R2.Fl]
MFANRFTAFIDACTLAGVLRRNLLLSLAEAEFFRVRWSPVVMEETQKAIEKMLVSRGDDEAPAKALRHRLAMEAAFEDAMVTDFDSFLAACRNLPDPKDVHVVAAAMKTRAHTIVTENLTDFPAEILAPLGLEARSADAFIADTIALDMGRAVAVVRRMRERFKRPEKTADILLLEMEAAGLTETVDILKPHALSL